MENKKTPLVGIIVAVVTLIVLTVGATYAFFSVNVSKDFETTQINAGFEGIGNVALTHANSLQLDIMNVDMQQGDSDVAYYATSNGKTTVETSESIGEMVVTGDGMYTCEYTLKLDDNENSMYDAFQTMETKSTGQLILTVDGQELDLATASLFPQTITKTVTGLTKDTPKDIYAELKLINKVDVNQSGLAGTELDITITAEDFKCSGAVVELPVTSENLSTEVLGGLYRYQGTNTEVTDNYICFGTSDAETCKTNEDSYMYRIIGVTPDGELKVIKKTELTTSSWWTDSETDVPYPNSLVYNGLNERISEYIPSGWEDKISTRYWKFGQMNLEDLGTSIESETLIQDMSSITGDKIYNIEGNFKTGIEAKVGLMYVHDFYYQRESKTCAIDNVENRTSTECREGWLNLLNNDSDSDGFEWTMTYYGYEPAYGDYDAWSVNSVSGFANSRDLSDGFVGRPVFYLKSGLSISGEGTTESPYIIG